MSHDTNVLPPRPNGKNVTDVMILDALRDAAALIADPERWTQKAPARNAAGDPVDPHSDDAVCWCATGALARVTGKTSGYRPLYERARTPLYTAALEIRHVTPSGIAVVNDKLGHVPTLGMFQRAIELMENRIAAAAGEASGD